MYRRPKQVVQGVLATCVYCTCNQRSVHMEYAINYYALKIPVL